MYTFQTRVEHVSKSSEDYLVFHYNNYDREYENAGVLDEYNSET